MQEYFCEYLNTCITFHKPGATFCNKLNSKGKNSFFEYNKDFLANFLVEREKLLNDLKNGIIPSYCCHCENMKKIDSNNIDTKIKKLEIYHWDECNCACFYCSNRHETKLKITNIRNVKGSIEVHKVLKELHKKGLLSEDLELYTIGGEPTLLKEYPQILKFIQKHKYKVNILSNGIIYEEEIAKTLEKFNAELFISLDCGSKETFYKIKGVDKYNEVLKNIKKYLKKAKNKSKNIIIKYIILENINDNKEEIDKFLTVCNDIGVTNVIPSIEFCHGIDKKDPTIPVHICELYNYLKAKAKEINPEVNIATFDFVEKMIKNHSYKI